MLEKDNVVERRKKFERDWKAYILGFEDIDTREEEWNRGDRDLEAFYSGADISSPYLSESDKIKVKRYRREDYKR